ncbi:MAG: redoxin domain-containing protein [Mariniphaga sp.]|nr:redoxin domain-containing protein [Mariniphaga sp.]
MRKIVKLMILALAGYVAGYLLVKITGSYNEKKETEKKIQKLPDAQFISLTGDTVNLHDFDPGKPMIIIFFHPECDHCRYEAKEIGLNADAFQNCQMLMITFDDSIKRIENFCMNYHLWEISNFEVLLDPGNHFDESFGKTAVPSIFVYSPDRKLKKKFIGETKPEALINETILFR